MPVRKNNSGFFVTCEVTPHHIALCGTDEPYIRALVNPPLRSEEDRIAILEALRDGTVDVILPREPETEFTRIQNQTPFELREGDSVEIMLKKGSFNNCWVMAKHGATKRFGVDDNGLTD